MVPQELPALQMVSDASLPGLTALGGLPLCLELAHVARLRDSIHKHAHARRGRQGWTDAQIVLSLMLMRLAGGARAGAGAGLAGVGSGCSRRRWRDCRSGSSQGRRDTPAYRFLAIREPLRQLDLPGLEVAQQDLPFPVMEFGKRGRHKVFGIVTNRPIEGEELIWWYRERCGASEGVHSEMKQGLAGGKLPSGLFGANAAWWAIMVLALNLNTALKRLALGGEWVTKRLRAIRYAITHLPGRVVRHARCWWLRPMGGLQEIALR